MNPLIAYLRSLIGGRRRVAAVVKRFTSITQELEAALQDLGREDDELVERAQAIQAERKSIYDSMKQAEKLKASVEGFLA